MTNTTGTDDRRIGGSSPSNGTPALREEWPLAAIQRVTDLEAENTRLQDELFALQQARATALATQTLAIAEPLRSVDAILKQRQEVEALVEHVFIEGVHYGELFPGAKKRGLKLAGAELIGSLFGIRPDPVGLSIVEDWANGLFAYRYLVNLRSIGSDQIVGAGIGNCNSREDKYAWRWVKAHEVPSHMDLATLMTRGGKATEFVFAVEKAETTGKYGKPAEYWQRFQAAIDDGTALAVTKTSRDGRVFEAWEIDAVEYRIPNDNPYSIANTIDKMAQKRGFVKAIAGMAALSGMFEAMEDEDDDEQKARDHTRQEEPPTTVTGTARPAKPDHVWLDADTLVDYALSLLPDPKPLRTTVNDSCLKALGLRSWTYAYQGTEEGAKAAIRAAIEKKTTPKMCRVCQTAPAVVTPLGNDLCQACANTAANQQASKEA